jgi:hypothetical protein
MGVLYPRGVSGEIPKKSYEKKEVFRGHGKRGASSGEQWG